MTVAAGFVQSGEVEHSDLSGVDVRRIRGLGRRVRPADDALALRRLVRLMRDERYDIVHTHTHKAGALGRPASMLSGVRARVHTFPRTPSAGLLLPSGDRWCHRNGTDTPTA
jgi:hypothetical protein